MVLVDVEERRFPGRGKRRRRRSSERDFQIEDQRLLQIVTSQTFATTADLKRLLPKRMPKQFHTAHLAERLKTPRWTAQRIAYCLRQMGAVEIVGKEGNAILYSYASKKAA